MSVTVSVVANADTVSVPALDNIYGQPSNLRGSLLSLNLLHLPFGKIGIRALELIGLFLQLPLLRQRINAYENSQASKNQCERFKGCHSV